MNDQLNNTKFNSLSSIEIVQNLKATTPYMLRQDGTLLGCGVAHPYIKPLFKDTTESMYKNVYTHIHWLNWIYENTLWATSKALVNDILNYIAVDTSIPEKYSQEAAASIKQPELVETIDRDLVLEALNTNLNQEFCRVRTSNFKYQYGGNNGEIYFRISSQGFNWFNLIWDTVAEFDHFIKYITIMKDYATFGVSFDYYRYKDIIFNKLPVQDFLTLSGNPIIEDFKMEKSDKLQEKKITLPTFDFDTEDHFTEEEQEEYNIDENGMEEDSYELWHHCEWCKEPFPESDLKKDMHLGWLCDYCVDALESRGEKLTLMEEVKSTKDLEEKIEKHDTLNAKLFDENSKLRPEVKSKILEIAQDFTDGLAEDGIKFELADIVLVGSNCSYNYTDNSDLDIHLCLKTDNLQCPDNLYPLLYSAYRSIWNKNHDVSIYGIPVELFIETDIFDDNANDEKFILTDQEEEVLTEAAIVNKLVSNGIYSVLHDKWIKVPDKDIIPEVDQETVDAIVDVWKDKYNTILEYPSIEDIENYIEKVYDLRKQGISEEGEYAVPNLVFKELRNLGYLENLKELKRSLKDKELSLEADSAPVDESLMLFIK